MTKSRQHAGASPATPEESGPPFWLSRHEVLGIFGFWTVFGALTAANRLLDPYVPGGDYRRQPIEAVYWFFDAYLWAAVTPLIFWLAWRFRTERSDWIPRTLLFVGVGIVVSALMVLAGDVAWTEVLRLPRRGPPVGRSVSQILLRPWFLNDLLVYAGVLAAGFARDYFHRYRLRQEEAVQLEAHAVQLQAQLADARLEALRMQLNPHFLFNTLHAISALVERDPRGVRRMISRLSELLRYALNGAREPEVSVEQEFHFLRQYLDIMQVRFQGRLEVQTVIAPEAAGALVPTLILQPLVENAVKHGTSNLVEAGSIGVRAQRSDGRLVLTVRDNGPGPQADPAPAGAGVGLRNVRERLEAVYGGDHDLSLRPGDDGGAIAEIVIPFHTGADLRASDSASEPLYAGR